MRSTGRPDVFNVGAGEVLVLLLVGLFVLGPDKLPDVARRAGSALSELRRMSSGYQRELREALDDADRAPAEPPKRSQ